MGDDALTSMPADAMAFKAPEGTKEVIEKKSETGVAMRTVGEPFNGDTMWTMFLDSKEIRSWNKADGQDSAELFLGWGKEGVSRERAETVTEYVRQLANGLDGERLYVAADVLNRFSKATLETREG